jgi:Domain of unknown function (DUF4384)
MAKDPRMLTGGHVTGSLNRTEEKQLMAAALENQELFDEMLDLEPLRSALAAPEFRAQLRSDLRERVESQRIPIWERLRRLFWRPGVLPALSTIAVVCLIVLVRQGVLRQDSQVVTVALGPAGPLLRAAGLLDVRDGDDRLMRDVREQPVEKAASGAIAFDRSGNAPSYRVGDPLRIGFKVAQDASIVVVEERDDGTVTRLFPNRFQSSALVSGGQTIWVPPAGQGPLEVDGTPGRRTIRVLVFPSDVDPMDPNEPWEKLRLRASVLQKSFEVRP